MKYSNITFRTKYILFMLSFTVIQANLEIVFNITFSYLLRNFILSFKLYLPCLAFFVRYTGWRRFFYSLYLYIFIFLDNNYTIYIYNWTFLVYVSYILTRFSKKKCIVKLLSYTNNQRDTNKKYISTFLNNNYIIPNK